MKVGYHGLILYILLAVCDNCEKYIAAKAMAKKMRNGCQGIYQAEKSMFLML